MIILGVEPSWFSLSNQGALGLINDGLRYVVNGSSTGLFFVVPTSLDIVQISGQIDALSELGDFSVRLRETGVCYDDIHLSGPATSFPSLSDSSLSHWGCRSNQVFESYPPSFSPLAISNSYVGTFNIRARLLTPINPVTSVSRPYILTRDALIVSNPTSTISSTFITTTTESTSTTTFVTSISNDVVPIAEGQTSEVVTSSDINSIIATSTISLETTSIESVTLETSSSTPVYSSTVSIVSAITTASETESTETPVTPESASVEASTIDIEIAPSSFIPLASTIAPVSGTTASSSSESLASETPSPNSFPEPVAAFSFLGCVGSHDGHPAFNLVASSPLMDLEMCAEACEGHLYAGVFNK